MRWLHPLFLLFQLVCLIHSIWESLSTTSDSTGSPSPPHCVNTSHRVWEQLYAHHSLSPSGLPQCSKPAPTGTEGITKRDVYGAMTTANTYFRIYTLGRDLFRTAIAFVPQPPQGLPAAWWGWMKPLLSVVALVRKTLKIPMIVFWGRFLWMPKRLPVGKRFGLVYGKPIPTVQKDEPTDEDVRAAHAQYVAEIERIFEQYKGEFGYDADEKLVVL